MKSTIYKALKIEDNVLTINGVKLYKFSSDELTQQVLNANINEIKRQIKNSNHIKTALSNIVSVELNHISNSFITATILYYGDDRNTSRCFKTSISFDMYNGLVVTF